MEAVSPNRYRSAAAEPVVVEQQERRHRLGHADLRLEARQVRRPAVVHLVVAVVAVVAVEGEGTADGAYAGGR
jgi:hypothetical protein